GGEEGLSLRLVLFAQQRAGRVDEFSPGANQPRGAAQDLLLAFDEFGEIFRPHPPLGVGVTPPRSGAEARHVDEYPIEAADVALDPFVALTGQSAALGI